MRPMPPHPVPPTPPHPNCVLVSPPQAYAGNRAPVPIFIHLPWMDQAKNQEYVAKFMDYALAQPNTWVSERGRCLCLCCVGISQVWQRMRAGRQRRQAAQAHAYSYHVRMLPPHPPPRCCCSL